MRRDAGQTTLMYEKGKAVGVIHRTCTQTDIIAFIRYQKGLDVGEKIVIRLSDKPLWDGAEFQELQDRFEELRDGLMEFLDKHRDSEAWGRIVTGVEVKNRRRVPRIE